MQYEDYCSFETSKLLKECGYPQNTDEFEYTYDIFLKPDRSKTTVRPTLEQAKNWLRIERNLSVLITMHHKDCVYGYEVILASNSEECHELVSIKCAQHRYSYPQAVEAGILAALNYLKDK